MSYNNYYGNNNGGGGYGGNGGGYGGYNSSGGNRYGGYSSFRDREPIFFPSQLNRQEGYKQSGYGRYSNQEQRRRDLLSEQRNRRSDVHNKNRNFGHQGGHQHKRRPPPSAPPKPREYKDILSYSEYLVERPDDLEQWVIVACPKGKRCTLVAHKGITTQYDKTGRQVAQFPSSLPGGFDPAHLMPTHGAMRKTILDCVYSESDSTYYVLDVLMWNMHPFIECETALRFFWLQTRLQEVDVASLSKTNAYRILPAVRFNVIDMQAHLLLPALYPPASAEPDAAAGPVTDGFLFYHPEAIYMSGTTPLVGWLKGYMIPEIINHIQLHPVYTDEKPADYTTLAEHVATHGNSYGQKKKKKKGGAGAGDKDKMDTDEKPQIDADDKPSIPEDHDKMEDD